MTKHFTLLLFIGWACGQSIDINNKIARYNLQDIENNYLIDDKELWYMAAVIVITLPVVPWLRERQKQQEIDRQMDTKSYYSGEGANPEQWEELATIGIKPGIIIGIIGIIGSKIKTGQKEILIEHSRIKELKLSDALSKEAITLLILAYNSLLNE